MALLTSADFAGKITPQLLINLTRDAAGATTPDETVIDSCSAKSWAEMWEELGKRYTKPATCPAGSCMDILLTVTRYWMYSRRPENVAGPEGEVVYREYADVIKRCKRAGDGDAVIEGLSLLTDDEADAQGGSFSYYSNDVVYTKTNYRGF